MTEDILLAVNGAVATVTLNRPQALNAMTDDMYHAIEATADDLASRSDVRVVVFRGAGERAFAAGADIVSFQTMRTAEDVDSHEAAVERAFDAIEDLPQPTIAMIRGYATGGGAILAACCDLRIGSDDAKIGVPVARTLGNCLPIASLVRLTDILGPAMVKELVITARLISAQNAKDAGFLNEVVAKDDLEDHVTALAETIAGHAPLTMRATKEAILRLSRERRRVSLNDLMHLCYLSEDFSGAVSAFVEKRAPVWRGR